MAQASVWGEPCFNSIKVRLKQDAVDFVLNANYFQFHKGPIKTSIINHIKLFISSFNSMKVRLKHAYSNPVGNFIRFQFHEGPIKTAMSGVALKLLLNNVSIP
ncbi:unknown [Prevotella sp. CAG:5226]|nr:unknown [Prevotella sp. CAG:5226]